MSTLTESATARAVRHILAARAFAEPAAQEIIHSSDVYGTDMWGQPWWDFPRIREVWLWSGGQHVALRAAESLHCGTPFPGPELVGRMDVDLQLCVLQAYRIRMGMDPGEPGPDLDHACVVCSQVGGSKVRIAEPTSLDGLSARPLYAHPHCLADDEGEAVPA